MTENARLERNAYQREWASRNRERTHAYAQNRVRPKYSQELYAKTRLSRLKAQRRWKLKNKYGLTEDGYYAMLENQKEKCAICGRDFTDEFFPQIDHDHVKNIVRGLLCMICNTSLRSIDADRTWGEKALNYLGGR